MGYQLLKCSLHRKSFLSCLLSRSQKVSDKVCTLLYLRLCLLRYFWYKRDGIGERYISQNLTWICKWISIYSPWNLSKDVCHVGILIRAGGGIYQIGYSSLWQFILIKKGLIQWFLHCCQVFTVGSHQAWWYSKHIKW